MIDRRTSFERPEPTPEELDALTAFAPDGWVDLRKVAETRDAPPLVMSYVDRWAEAFARWEATASERPLEHATNRPAVRMFGGRWLPHRLVAESDEWQTFPVREYMDHFERGADEVDLRRMASAIYEWCDRRNASHALLMDAMGSR